jgi:phosphoribosylformylglycinamidine synthase subunit PurQ / glutaminase
MENIMKKPKVIVLRTAGTNCDKETAFAFQTAGANAEVLHINEFISRKKTFDSCKILAIPGGFSYGDDIASGKVFANELIYKLRDSVEKFIKNGKLIIGICNGFQVLVKTGLLPHSTLTFNDSGKFEDRWVYLKNINRGNCIFTRGIDTIYLPVAHGEGKFVTDKQTLKELKKNNEIVFKYVDIGGKEAGYPWNPNGAMENIAGICNKEGNVFGMMPHPERFIFKYHHPRWQREKLSAEGDGIKIFRNAVLYAAKHL